MARIVVFLCHFNLLDNLLLYAPYWWIGIQHQVSKIPHLRPCLQKYHFMHYEEKWKIFIYFPLWCSRFCLNDVAFRVLNYFSGLRDWRTYCWANQDLCSYLSGASAVVTNKETWVNLTKPVENTSDFTPESKVQNTQYLAKEHGELRVTERQKGPKPLKTVTITTTIL